MPPQRWTTIPADEVAAHPGELDRIIGRSEDGMVVTGVFSPEEVATALTAFDECFDLRDPFPRGFLLGMSIGNGDAEDRELVEYVENTTIARRAFLDAFGFDPHDRVMQVLSPMTRLAMPGLVPVGSGAYSPGQMRWFEPDLGGLPAHAGNEFNNLLRDAGMKVLMDSVSADDHLSYFVVLQKPENGGSLSVFDLLFDDYPEHPVPWGVAARDDSWFDTVSSVTIDAEPGDLVVFGGGWRWHRVEPVHGSRPRITYGGFAAPAKNGRDLHFWA